MIINYIYFIVCICQIKSYHSLCLTKNFLSQLHMHKISKYIFLIYNSELLISRKLILQVKTLSSYSKENSLVIFPIVLYISTPFISYC